MCVLKRCPCAPRQPDDGKGAAYEGDDVDDDGGEGEGEGEGDMFSGGAPPAPVLD